MLVFFQFSVLLHSIAHAAWHLDGGLFEVLNPKRGSKSAEHVDEDLGMLQCLHKWEKDLEH